MFFPQGEYSLDAESPSLKQMEVERVVHNCSLLSSPEYSLTIMPSMLAKEVINSLSLIVFVYHPHHLPF